MHLKRQEAPKKWPIPRKGTVYVAKPSFNLKNGIPLLVVLRDVLKIIRNRKEAKMALNLKNIFVNEKAIAEENHGLVLFDKISVIPLKKHYVLDLASNGKFRIEEINEKDAKKKVAKVIGKKTLNKKRKQINLSDGRNFISDIECKVNDSVLINFKDGKIEKCLPLKEKANAIVFEGKHSGERGFIEKINSETKMAELIVNKNKINVLIKQMMVTE